MKVKFPNFWEITYYTLHNWVSACMVQENRSECLPYSEGSRDTGWINTKLYLWVL